MDAFMQALKDRRTVLVLVGAALALVAGLVLANMLMNRHQGEANLAPPAAQGRSARYPCCFVKRNGGEMVTRWV